MFNDDDLDPKTNKPKPRNLEPLSVAELEEYIQDLRTEIDRAKTDIDKKTAQKSAADALFK